MTKIRNQMVLAGALAAAVTAAASGSQAAPSDADLQRCLAVAAEEADFSGVAMLARAGEEAAAIARGTMGPGDPRPITAETRFNIASVGKLFTALAIGQLVEAGTVNFDDSVGRWLPDAPPAIAGLRVDQLLTHTSGLGDYIGPTNRAEVEAAQSVDDLLRIVYATESPAAAPTLLYSNAGYVVLGAIVERASGQSYGDYLQDHIFGPAGMTDTALRADPGLTATPVTSRPGQPAASNAELASPAGGAFSSAADLVAFARAIASGALLSADALQDRLPADVAQGGPIRAGDPPAPAPAVGGDMLPGLDFVTGERTLTAGGGASGVNAALVILPGFDWTVVVLSGLDPPAADMLAMRITPWLSAESCG